MTTIHLKAHDTNGCYSLDLNDLKDLPPADKIKLAEAMFDIPPNENDDGELVIFTDLMMADGVVVPFIVEPPAEPEHSFDESELCNLHLLLSGDPLVGDMGEVVCYAPLDKAAVDTILATVPDDVKQKIADDDYALAEAGVLFVFEPVEHEDPIELEEEPLDEEEAVPDTLREGSAALPFDD